MPYVSGVCQAALVTMAELERGIVLFVLGEERLGAGTAALT